MNQPEHTPHNPPHNSDPISEEGGRHMKSTADYFIEDQIMHAPTPEMAKRYAELYQQHGEPFAIYLSLEPTHTDPETLGLDYQDAYYGTFPDRDVFREEVLTSLGWAEALDKARNEAGIPEDALQWNTDYIDEDIEAAYDLVEIGGKIYVFNK